MRLPFSIEQFHQVFRDYNTTVWPMQVVLNLLAVTALFLVLFPNRNSGRRISLILSALWLWMAIAYHGLFFTRINPAAYAFVLLFLAGSALFAWHGLIHPQLTFRSPRRGWSAFGWSLVVYALIVYPIWLQVAGHRFPSTPAFGLPCPTTLFTIGLLAFLQRPYPRVVLVVPILWCAIGAQAAFLLGVTQDLGLLVAAILGVILFIRASKKTPATAYVMR